MNSTKILVYQIKTDVFYIDIKPDLNKYFDTSDYHANNIYDFPCINKIKKLWYCKDENNGKIFTEFVGSRSKMYAMNVENNIIKKAKGFNKCITKTLQVNDYKSCLLNNNILLSEMCRFKSLKHVIFTQKIYKISLSCNDNKRYIWLGEAL